jgi:hypothetical protein
VVRRSRLQFGYARIRNAICGLVNLILVISFIDVVVDLAGARSLVVLPPRAGLVILRQTFVRRSHGGSYPCRAVILAARSHARPHARNRHRYGHHRPVCIHPVPEGRKRALNRLHDGVEPRAKLAMLGALQRDR